MQITSGIPIWMGKILLLLALRSLHLPVYTDLLQLLEENQKRPRYHLETDKCSARISISKAMPCCMVVYTVFLWQRPSHVLFSWLWLKLMWILLIIPVAGYVVNFPSPVPLDCHGGFPHSRAWLAWIKRFNHRREKCKHDFEGEVHYYARPPLTGI